MSNLRLMLNKCDLNFLVLMCPFFAPLSDLVSGFFKGFLPKAKQGVAG